MAVGHAGVSDVGVSTASVSGSEDEPLTWRFAFNLNKGSTVSLTTHLITTGGATTNKTITVLQSKALSVFQRITRVALIIMAKAQALSLLRSVSKRATISQGKTLTTTRLKAATKVLNFSLVKTLTVRRRIVKLVNLLKDQSLTV